MGKLKTGRHTSAIKTQRMALRRTLHNRSLKKTARESVKDLYAAAQAKDKPKTQDLFNKACSAWDKAAQKGSVHWKSAARKKSRMAKQSAKLLAAQPPAPKKSEPAPAA
ncbi:MAG: 30S ribosomal protein S20 [Elusimicrobia bacterium]|nr:30S ribosomal protein S20 [Elusimicrobiota bacterium]